MLKIRQWNKLRQAAQHHSEMVIKISNTYIRKQKSLGLLMSKICTVLGVISLSLYQLLELFQTIKIKPKTIQDVSTPFIKRKSFLF